MLRLRCIASIAVGLLAGMATLASPARAETIRKRKAAAVAARSLPNAKLVLAVAAALFFLPTKGRADTLTMTELSSQNLSVSLTLFGNTYYTNTLFQNGGGGDYWATTVGSGIPFFFPWDPSQTTIIYRIAWAEPGNNSLYNLLTIDPSGNLGTTFISMYSDVNHDTLAYYGFYSGGGGCKGAGGPETCPLLQNNTSYDIPIYLSPTIYSTLTVTFNDLGDVASTTPLPSTWLMLLSGFVGLGFIAYRGMKRRSALAAT